MGTFGYKPFVVAPENGIYRKYDDSLLSEIEDKCRIYRAPFLFPGNFAAKIGLRNGARVRDALFRIWDRYMVPDGKVIWLLSALRVAVDVINRENVDIIYSTGSPFSGFMIGVFAKKITGRKLVLDYRDPWHINTLRECSRFRMQVEKKIEDYVVGNADLLIMNTERSLKKYQNVYGHSPKTIFAALENAYDQDLESRLEIDNSGWKGQEFNILYCGSFYGGRNPNNFFKGLKLLFEKKPELRPIIKFVYVGLNRKIEYLDIISRLGIGENVVFNREVESRHLMKFFQLADLLLVVNDIREGQDLFIPQKFYDYLMTEKPIICLSKEGALKDIVTKTGCGLVADPEDCQDISMKIQECFERIAVFKRGFPVRQKEEYSGFNKTKQLCNLFDLVMGHLG